MDYQQNIDYLTRKCVSSNPYARDPRPDVFTGEFEGEGIVTWIHYECLAAYHEMFVRHSDGKVCIWDDHNTELLEFDTPDGALDFVDELAFDSWTERYTH